MRSRGFSDVGTSSALAGKEIDKLRHDQPASTDTMLLHDDREDVTFLIEISELFTEAEKPLFGDRSSLQSDAVYVRGVRSVGADDEAQGRRREGFESKLVLNAAGNARQLSGYRRPATGDLDLVDRWVPVRS